MKKLLLILCVVACLAIVACADVRPTEQTTDDLTPTTENQTPTNEPMNESSEQKEEPTEEPTEEIIDPTAPQVVIYSTATELIAGQEFTFTVAIANNPGIFSFTFDIPVDTDVFEFVSADTSETICSTLGICGYDETTSSYKFNGYGESPFENLTDDGTIVTVTLKVKDSAVAGKYSISINPDDKNIINVDAQKVAFAGAKLKIVVTE